MTCACSGRGAYLGGSFSALVCKIPSLVRREGVQCVMPVCFAVCVLVRREGVQCVMPVCFAVCLLMFPLQKSPYRAARRTLRVFPSFATLASKCRSCLFACVDGGSESGPSKTSQMMCWAQCRSPAKDVTWHLDPEALPRSSCPGAVKMYPHCKS